MSDRATANLFLATISAGLLASTVRSPLLLALPQFTLGGYGLAVAVHRQRRDRIGLGEYGGAVAALGGDVLALYDNAPEVRVATPSFLPAPLRYVGGEADSTAWATATFMDSSKMVIGAPGTGKTTWLYYEAVEFVERHPGGTLRIVDPHYDSEESRWLPGIPPDLLQERYLYSSTGGAWSAFVGLLEELERRIAGGLKKEPYYKLICDEFQNIPFTEAQRVEVVDIIGRVAREGRKYRIRLTLGLHSGKKSQTALDSSLFSAFTLMAMGRTLADQGLRANLPGDMDAGRLLSEVDGLIDAGLDRRRVAAIRPASDVDLGFYSPAAKVLPDPQVEALVVAPVSEESWLATHRQEVEELVAQGLSFSKVAKRFGLQLHKVNGQYKDPRVQALRDFHDSQTQVLEVLHEQAS